MVDGLVGVQDPRRLTNITDMAYNQCTSSMLLQPAGHFTANSTKTSLVEQLVQQLFLNTDKADLDVNGVKTKKHRAKRKKQIPNPGQPVITQDRRDNLHK